MTTAMKRLFHFMPIAVAMAAATIISCQKAEEEVNQNKDEQKVEEPTIASLTFTISDNETTKTVIADDEGKKYADWETGDKIGYVTSKSDKGYATVTLGTPATFTIAPTTGLAVDNVVNVWYPYRKDESNKASVQMVIPVNQVQSGDTFDFDAMPMVAEPITITSEMLSGSNYAGTINFANLASLIEFKVFSTAGTYASEKVVAITFDAGSSNIAGHFNMNVGAVDFGTPATLGISGYTGKSVTTSLASAAAIGNSKATAKNVYMVVAPGTYSGSITVITDAAFYTIPVSGKEFERSGFKSFGIDLAKEVATRRSLKGSTTIQLNQISYSYADTDEVIWEDGLSLIDVTEGTSSANNYLPPKYSSSRFYNTGTLTFATGSKQVEKVVFTSTSESYASALAGSTWDNATATASETTVTVRPIDGSTGFGADITENSGHTKIQIYYDDNVYAVEDGTITGDGSLSYSATSSKVNTTITITATPGSGQVLSSLSVKDSENNDVTVTSNQFRMPASDVTVSATFVDGSTSGISMATNAAEDTNTAAGTTATLSGTITLEGAAVIGSVTEAGFYYKAVGAADYTKVTLGSAPSTTTYTYALTGLTAGTEYTYYSYAKYNSGSEVLGSATEKTFTPLKLWSMTIDANASGNNEVHWTSKDAASISKGTGANKVTWATSVTWANGNSWGNGKDYLQIGAGPSGTTPRYASSVVLTTSDITGTIKGIEVDCASYNGVHTMSASVNGTAFKSATDATTQSTPAWSAGIATISATGSASGEIRISFTGASGARALYLKKVAILYY